MKQVVRPRSTDAAFLIALGIGRPAKLRIQMWDGVLTAVPLARRLFCLGLILALAGCGAGSVPSPSSAGTTTARQTAAPTPTTSPVPTNGSPTNVLAVPGEFPPLEPRSYYVEPENIPVRVVYTVHAEGWLGWIGTFKPEQTPGRAYRHVGMSIVNVTNLVTHGCTDHRAADPPVGPRVEDLAQALATLQPFVVTKPPSDVTIYGYRGQFLEFSIPEMRSQPGLDALSAGFFPDCTERRLKSWIGEPLSYAFWGYTDPGEHEEFWVLDVEGSRLVIEASWSPDSPTQDLAELRAILDSIRIEPAS
jgi:hypothetical protein